MEMHTSSSLYAIHGITGHRRQPVWPRLVAAVSSVIAARRRERRIRRAIDELQSRDDRLLSDIGICRGGIEDFVRRGARSHLLLAAAGLSTALLLAPVPPAQAGEPASITRGARLAITNGCHDCHTPGYNESGGKVDPAKALIGSHVGFRGPWGTSYPTNLRVTAASLTEAGFVEYARSFNALPPMPWYNVHAMKEGELRDLHRYILSLGTPGEAAPAALPPGAEPATPYISLMPVIPAPR